MCGNLYFNFGPNQLIISLSDTLVIILRFGMDRDFKNTKTQFLKNTNKAAKWMKTSQSMHYKSFNIHYSLTIIALRVKKK